MITSQLTISDYVDENQSNESRRKANYRRRVFEHLRKSCEVNAAFFIIMLKHKKIMFQLEPVTRSRRKRFERHVKKFALSFQLAGYADEDWTTYMHIFLCHSSYYLKRLN